MSADGGEGQMPRGFPEPAEPIDLSALLERVRERHRAADDSRLELFPDLEAPEAAFAVLLFARLQRRALPAAARREEELDRFRLVRHLRQVLDAEELAAHNDALADGLANLDVGEVLGITSKAGVKQRRKRLAAAAELGRNAGRDPKFLSEHRAQEAAVAARPRDWLAGRVGEVYDRSRELLDVRHQLAGSDESAEWLTGLEDLLTEDREDRDHDHNVLAHLRFAVEELQEAAREGPAPTEGKEGAAADALRVLEAAAALIEDYVGRSGISSGP